MGIADILEPLNESVASRLGSFRAIGEPGLYETNESTPAGFYEDLRRRFRPDGYVYGPGCGNVLSMVEAFEDRPRGLVLVDLDPAVVLASRILVGVLQRQETAAGWAEELFCGGAEGANALVGAALEAEPSPSLRRHMEQHVDRFLRGLASLSDDFELAPDDVPDLLDRWAGHHPPRGKPVPVRTFVVRNYDKLRATALDRDVAVLLGSLLDPELLEAVSALPEMADRTSLIYVSNIADHFRRRALRLDALARLKLAPDREGGDFLSVLNDERLGRLQQVTQAADDVVTVRSVGIGSLSLEATSGVPRYTEDDFGPGVDLGRIVPHFLRRLAGAPKRSEDGKASRDGDPWRSARRHRAAALDLYAVGIAGERPVVRTCLDRVTRDATRIAETSPTSGVPYDAFWLAEATLPLVLLGRAGSLPREVAVEDVVELLADRVSGALENVRQMSDERPAARVLCAQALAGAGAFLAREDLQRIGRGLHRAAISTADPLQSSIPTRAEILLRSTWIAAIVREPELLHEVQPYALGLLRSLRAGEIVELSTTPSVGEGFVGVLGDPRMVSENLRLGLLFFGLLAEEVRAIEGALFLDHRVRHPEDVTPPEPDAILASLAQDAAQRPSTLHAT